MHSASASKTTPQTTATQPRPCVHQCVAARSDMLLPQSTTSQQAERCLRKDEAPEWKHLPRACISALQPLHTVRSGCCGKPYGGPGSSRVVAHPTPIMTPQSADVWSTGPAQCVLHRPAPPTTAPLLYCHFLSEKRPIRRSTETDQTHRGNGDSSTHCLIRPFTPDCIMQAAAAHSAAGLPRCTAEDSWQRLPHCPTWQRPSRLVYRTPYTCSNHALKIQPLSARQHL